MLWHCLKWYGTPRVWSMHKCSIPLCSTSGMNCLESEHVVAQGQSQMVQPGVCGVWGYGRACMPACCTLWVTPLGGSIPELCCGALCNIACELGPCFLVNNA
jgi:hypothetical protein